MSRLRWSIVPFSAAVVAAGYLGAALTRAVLRTWWPDVSSVIPLYGIAVGAALVVIGLTWNDLPGLVTVIAGSAVAAASGLLLIGVYGQHPEIFLFAWVLVPAVSAVAVLMFGQIYNDLALSVRALKAYVYSIIGFVACAIAIALVAWGRSWLRSELPPGLLSWLAVLVGLTGLIGAIVFAIVASRSRAR